MPQSNADWYVYILECADNSLYTGITNDLGARIEAHNDGKAAKYTRSRRPVALVFSKPARDKSEALRMEMALKGLSRAQKQALIKA